MKITKLIINMLLIAIVVWASSSCSHTTTKDYEWGTDDVLDEYDRAAREFYIDFPYAKKVMVNVEKELDEVPSLLGVCLMENDVINVYEVSRKSSASQISIKELVYHELGHCALGLAHVWNSRRIMNASGPSTGDMDNTKIERMRTYHKDTCEGKELSLAEDAYNISKGMWWRHISCENREKYEGNMNTMSENYDM